MLRIYATSIDLVRDAGHIARRLATHDQDLARQLRRAAASVALNIAEGEGSSAGTRRTRYTTAMGSAREVRACYDVAAALGYLEAGIEERDRLDRVVATLYKLTRH